MAALTKRFGADMTRGINEVVDSYNPTLFRRMLADHGPVEAVRRLVLDPKPSYGLWRLKELGRLDLSAEMWVLLPWYKPLFSPDVRDQARRKLEALEVDVPAELSRLVRRLDPGYEDRESRGV
jgi:hypothetical protein